MFGFKMIAGATALALTAGAVAAETVTVAYFLEWPTANQVAQVNETYQDRMGVDVEWRAFGNGNEMTQAMASGAVDIAFSQGLVPFVVAVSNGLPLELVGVAVSYAEADNCVVHQDAGITQDNAAEALVGQTIATPIGNVTHYKLLRMLDHLGVNTDDVNFVQMNGADAAVALARGDVAIGCAFGGALQRMLEFGAPLMTAAEQEAIGIRVFDVISVTSDFAAEHPELLQTFMDVTDEANMAYSADPGAYVETIAGAAGMDLAATENMLGMFSFPSSADQASEAWLGGTVQTFMKEVADFFVEQGQLDVSLEDYGATVNAAFVN
ncbi:taurine ABC transporter substrate-binding protein [Rhodophyticola sp. CCM32]|uniref:taurine ABC transporter substrate-binding protein n=1 Tax=Rhodophyticola sp. CCM32 TaxID=2916397 RepID=UPI00107F3AA2|nr:ABC transporter substrate-binding protein [Rhodophyticola sp. CCM32]QBX99900.1 taurine ABC transporter substrate-binding protein [Rhodophyticola sp. CCM32]